MGLCKSKLGLSRSNIISPSSSTDSSFNNAILTSFSPNIKICRAFGVFPCEVVENEESKKLALKANKKWWLVYTVIIWLITSVYIGFQAVSLFISISKGDSVIKLVAQSLWFNAGLVPYCVSIFMILSFDRTVEIFQVWSKIETELQALFCYLKTEKHIRNFRRTYLTLAVISISTCAYHSIKDPTNPVYPMHYYFTANNSNNSSAKVMQYDVPVVLVYGYSLLQIVIMGWKWAGFAVLEGLCCFFATVFIQCMESVMEGLDLVLKQTKSPEVEETLDELLNSVIKDSSQISESEKSKNASKSCPTHRRTKTSKGRIAASSMPQEEYLMFAIRNLQTFASLQSHINSVFGPLLLLDFGQLVLMTCALTFLPIAFAKTVDTVSIIVFVGNWLTVLSRLVLIIMCLGNVYTKGQEVNVGLAKAMNSCQLSPIAQSSVLAHLTVFSSNPVSFTAWGFFPITRGTLLAAFSLISTYAVVFLQLNV